MPVIIKKINESHVQLKNFDKNISQKLRDNFSFYPPNYKFNPKYKAGYWNGLIHLFDINTGKLPIGLAKKAYKLIRTVTTDIVCDLNLFDKGLTVSKQEILDFCKLIKLPFEPYEHQIKAVQKCLKEKKLTIESATGSGKSLNLFLIANFLLMNNKSEKILLIVPSVQLVEQMTKDFQDYAKNWCDYSKFVHKIYSGQDKTTNKQITISTYQSLINIPKLWKNYSVVFLDECHSIFANSESTKSVNKIVNGCTNAEYKFGFSGSLLNDRAYEIQLNSLFGPLERIVNAKDLIDAGILAEFEVKSIILDYHADRKIDLKNQIDNIPKTKHKIETAKYNLNMNYIRNLDERDKFVVNFCTKIKQNTIVLFKNLEYGTKIYKELYKKSGKRVYYIDGSIPVLKREEIRANIEKYDDCILVGSIKTVGTGLNIKNIFNAVLIESTKAEIGLIQMIGRLLRKLEGKKSVMYDISDNLSSGRWSCYSTKHFKNRLSIYKKQGHKVKIMKMKI